MVWREALSSPALQVLFDKLASGEVLELLRSCNISDFPLEKLKLAYLASITVLYDAEEKQFESLAVETWLDMLKAAAYEAWGHIGCFGHRGGSGRSHKHLEVIPLVGIGGLGKTVLAQLVFNEARIDEFFDVKAWECVSDEFDLLRVTKDLLESATGNLWETNNLKHVQKSLTNILS